MIYHHSLQRVKQGLFRLLVGRENDLSPLTTARRTYTETVEDIYQVCFTYECSVQSQLKVLTLTSAVLLTVELENDKMRTLCFGVGIFIREWIVPRCRGCY